MPANMPEHLWEVYWSERDGAGVSVVFDQASKDLDFTEFKYSVRVHVPAVDLRENGFPSQEDFEHVYAFVDAINLAVSDRARNVGRVVSPGAYDLYWYSLERDTLQSAIETHAAKELNRQVEIEIVEDQSGASFCKHLWPTPIEWQFIMDERLLSNLDELGDRPECVRPIDHFFYFPKKAQRDEYATWLEAQGYELVSHSDPDPEGDSQDSLFRIQAKINARTTRESVRKITLSLYDSANEHGGDYDGWESIVVTDCESDRAGRDSED